MRSALIAIGLLAACTLALAYDPYLVAQRTAYQRLVGVADTFPTDDLVAYWSMDSRSGDDETVFDTFGTNELTQNGGVLFGSAYGKYLDGANFDGNNDYLAASSAILGATNDWSVSFWTRFETQPGVLANILSQYIAGEAGRFGIWFVEKRLRAQREGSIIAEDTDDILVGVWTHYMVTKKSNVYTIYRDGIQKDQGTQNNPIQQTAVNVGGISGANFWYDGDIDEVAIWNRALSSNEVSRLHDELLFYTP